MAISLAIGIVAIVLGVGIGREVGAALIAALTKKSGG